MTSVGVSEYYQPTHNWVHFTRDINFMINTLDYTASNVSFLPVAQQKLQYHHNVGQSLVTQEESGNYKIIIKQSVKQGVFTEVFIKQTRPETLY